MTQLLVYYSNEHPLWRRLCVAGRAHSEILKSTASSTMHIKGKWKMLKYGNQSMETKYEKQSMEVRRKVTY